MKQILVVLLRTIWKIPVRLCCYLLAAVVGLPFGLWAGASPAMAIEVVKLEAVDGQAKDRFGGDVAIDGGWAIVGASGDDNKNGDNAGSAYIFKRGKGGEWFQQAKLMAEDGMPEDRFGSYVSLSGNKAVVGTGNESVYILERDNFNQWSQVSKITAATLNDAGANEPKETIRGIGRAISVSGNTVVVGASGHVKSDSSSIWGFYVFQRDAKGQWRFQTKVFNNGTIKFFRRVNSLSLSGNNLLMISVSGSRGSGIATTAANAFSRNETGEWVEEKGPLLTATANRNRKGGRSSGTLRGNFENDGMVISKVKTVFNGKSPETTASTHIFTRNFSDDPWREVSIISPGLLNAAISNDKKIVGVARKDGKNKPVIYHAKAAGKWRITEPDNEDGSSVRVSSLNVAISGATGVVGKALIKHLGQAKSTIQFSGKPTVFNETSVAAEVEISRKLIPNAVVGEVFVDCVTTDAGGTAVAGVDYEAVQQTFRWPDDSAETKVCSIPLINDEQEEEAETIVVNLIKLRGDRRTRYGVPTQIVVTIEDDDTPPAPAPEN